MNNSINTNTIDFLSPLSVVPGFGPKRIKALECCGFKNVGDLLYHLPTRYLNHSRLLKISELGSYINEYCCISGVITKTRIERGRKSRFRIKISDDSGSVEAVWFNGVQFVSKSLVKGKKIFLAGKLSVATRFQFVHPSVEIMGATFKKRPFVPHYSIPSVVLESGIGNKTLRTAIKWLLDNLIHYPRTLPDYIEKRVSLPTLKESLENIHFPKDSDNLEKYFDRLKYEELYQLAISLYFGRKKFTEDTGREMSAGNLTEKLKNILPFKLTHEQERIIEELHKDSASPNRMHRLLFGDVGSGKTITSLFATLPSLNEGLQVVWMSPTSALASQSYSFINNLLSKLNYRVELLTGDTDKVKRREIISDAKNGKIDFIVGTHAVMGSKIDYKKIGMIIIDEQHKFGARQRLLMQQKDKKSDFLLISATPIPQTLAQTLYSDLLPISLTKTHVKRDVTTRIVPEIKRGDMIGFIKKEIESNGAQIFYIVPRIESNDESALNLKDTESVRRMLRSVLPQNSIEVITGISNPKEREKILSDFANKKLSLLIATTVVEVGIDIPNASIIVIENSERFGFSQLHQLRGRIGRDGKKAYAFLLTANENNPHTIERLKRFCKTNNGFELSELDLSMRGPGQVEGFRQSGFSELSIADIINDASIFKSITEDIRNFMDKQ